MLGLDLIAAHMVGDFVFQTDDVAKRKLSDWRVRAVHVSLYCAALLPVVGMHWPGAPAAAAFVALAWVTHFVTDSRQWARGDAWPPKPILVDQAIHLATLAVLARLLDAP